MRQLTRVAKPETGRNVKIHEDGTVTARDCAALLNITHQAFEKWISKGCPVAFQSANLSKNTPRRVRMDDVLKWKCGILNVDDDEEEAFNLEKSKARRAHMLADIEEMRRDEQFRRTTKIEDVARVVEDEYIAIRSAIMTMPAKLSVHLSTLEDTREIHNYLREQCVDILNILSDPKKVAANSIDKKFVGGYDELEEMINNPSKKEEDEDDVDRMLIRQQKRGDDKEDE